MQHIPRICYMYWEGPMPQLVSRCIQKTRDLNPDWEIIVASALDIKHDFGTDNMDSPAHRSDFYRITKIYETGGVWLDASIIPLGPIADWVDLYSSKLQGFTAPHSTNQPPKTHSLIENWAFAAPPKHPVVESWLDEFKHALQVGFRDYQEKFVSRCDQDRVYCKDTVNSLPYLTQHGAFAVVIQNLSEEEFNEHIDLKMSVSRNGPFEIFTLNPINYLNQDYDSFMNMIDRPPFIKLSHYERNPVIEYLDKGFFTKDSLICRALDLTCPTKSRSSLPMFVVLLLLLTVGALFYVFLFNK